jgi:hypothetical protein
MAAAAFVLGGCGGTTPTPQPAGGLVIAFEDREAPEVLAVRAEAAVASAAEGGGLWAAVPGLRQPERGRVGHGGAVVDVSLFRGAGQAVRLSAEAARRLGVAGGDAAVEVVALRSEPRVQAPPTAF